MKIWKQYIGLLAIIALIFTFSTCDFGNDNNNNNGNDTPTGVEPLLKTKWHQGDPFNLLFPIVDSKNIITGCGNIAWAQIMKYHKHPISGNGESTSIYDGTNYHTVPSVNLNVNYDWNNMLNFYRRDVGDGTEQQRNAVATLTYHIAASRKVNNIDNITDKLVTVFGYDRSIQWHYRRFYTDAEWEAIIKKQLDASLPVYCWGDDPSAPHTFVIDGYDNSGKFHINMGWSGQDDGWYSLNNINPSVYGGIRRFYNNQYIIINVKPNVDSIGSNEWALNSFTTDKTIVSKNEIFTVAFRPMSLGFFTGGQIGIVLVDNNNNIVEVGTRNTGEVRPGAGWILTTTILEMNCSVPETVDAGQYRLMVVTKVTGGEWKIVTVSDKENNTPNSIPFTVQ